MRTPLQHATLIARRSYSHSVAKTHGQYLSLPKEKRTHDVILDTPSQVAYYSRHSSTEIHFDTSMLRQLKNIDAMGIRGIDLRAMFAEYAAQRDANPFFQEDYYAQNKQAYQLHNLDDMLAACLWHGTPSSWRQADVIAPDSTLMAYVAAVLLVKWYSNIYQCTPWSRDIQRVLCSGQAVPTPPSRPSGQKAA